MSSPVVAGAIALLFGRDASLTQGRITELLQTGARRLQGPVGVETQAGPGSLDMLGSLAALAAEDAKAGSPPDVAASWWTLSASYARPDPTWPVEGVVQLRRGDGTLASGLDGSLLRLEVDNGSVQKPLTKVKRVAGGLSVSSSRKGVVGPRVTITAEDLRNLADLFTRVRRYLLGDWQVDAFREKRMRFACDQLAGLHGIVSLGQQSPVFSPVRLYHVEAEPLVVDLDALRDAVRARHANQDAVFDLCLVTLHEGAMVDAMRLLWPQLQGATLTITGAERGALRVLVPADYER